LPNCFADGQTTAVDAENVALYGGIYETFELPTTYSLTLLSHKGTSFGRRKESSRLFFDKEPYDWLKPLYEKGGM